MSGAAVPQQSLLQSHAAHLVLLGAWLVIVAGAVGRSKWQARGNRIECEPRVVGGVRGRLTGWLGLVALCTAGAAAVHVSVIGEHFEEATLFGVFFVSLAAAQLGFAVLVVWRPSATLLKAGILASIAVIALWVVSRTVGIPIGPEAGTPEVVGVPDLLSTAFELLAAVASGPALRALRNGREPAAQPSVVAAPDRRGRGAVTS